MDTQQASTGLTNILKNLVNDTQNSFQSLFIIHLVLTNTFADTLLNSEQYNLLTFIDSKWKLNPGMPIRYLSNYFTPKKSQNITLKTLLI